MKYILLFLSMAFAIDNCLAQDTIKHFIAFDGITECSPNEGYYYRVATKEDEWWKVKYYYCEQRTLYMEGFYKNYSNDSFYNAVGMFVFFHPNRTLMKKVRYIDGKKEGMAKEYDSTGSLIDSGFYINDIRCKARYKWEDDALVFKAVYDDRGIGEEWYYYNNGKLNGYGKTGSGAKKDSTWVFYHQNGTISSVEKYYQDSLISAMCYDENGKKLDSCRISVMPEPPYNVNEFLGQNMVYPEAAFLHNIEGDVQVCFWIDIDGTVVHPFTTKRSKVAVLKEEGVRVISLMPKWKPGTLRGKPVRVAYTLPIRFRLD